MIGLDISQLPQEIVALLMSRGMEVPPLQWSKQPNRLAKSTLDAMDDAKLFGCSQLADEAMAGAVRALLYLWNGWPGDCMMCGQLAPEKERSYLSGFCERQARHLDAAKECFKKLTGHAIHDAMTAYAIGVIGSVDDPVLKRFKALLDQEEGWEVFLFVDLCDQVLAGKSSLVAEQITCRLQCREFELLFAYCYQQATGKTITDRSDEAEFMRKPRPRKSISPRPVRPGQSSSQSHSATPSKPASKITHAMAPAGPSTIRIACPKCEGIMSIAESSRGESLPCSYCGTKVMVPQKRSSTDSANSGCESQPSSGSAQVGVLCPKCGRKFLMPESSRGRKAKCRKCAAIFLIPQRQPVGRA